MGIESHDILAPTMTFDQFKECVRSNSALFRKRDGRYYTLLSLVEAEHLRSILHLRSDRSSLLSSESSKNIGDSVTSVKLWSLCDFDVSLVGSFSRGPAPDAAHALSSKFQHSVMTNCYRFMNSDTSYSDACIVVLLRVLQSSPLEDRRQWWVDIRACRRRNQQPWDGATPISSIFSTLDEFSFLEYKAVVERIRLGFVERGMFIFDAFRAINSSNTGLVSCSELYGALDWLGIQFEPEQVHDLVRKIAVGTEGLLSYADFKRVFQSPEDEFESRGGDSSSAAIMPKPMAELVELSKESAVAERVGLTADMLNQFKVKVKTITGFSQVWSSQGTQSKDQVSLWEPSIASSMLSSTRVCDLFLSLCVMLIRNA
jgi:hypothetical protein